MKIGITCYPTYGGSGVVGTELGMELAQRDHEVHFITYSQPIRLLEPQPNVHYHEVSVPSYPLFAEYTPYSLALASKMAEVAEIYGLDLLHVHYAIPHSVSALLARAMVAERNGRKLPFVTTLHGTDITLVGSDRSYLPITRYSIEQSNGITAISRYLCERTVRELEVRWPIQVIYNFVNCDVYQRDEGVEERRQQYAKDGESLLVHLSNFRPVKRVTDVVEIFDQVQQRLPARLLMVGDGPDRSAAEWLAHRKGISDKVHFLGKQERVNEILPLADVMLLPSQLESFGLAALEAMACEVIPVATRVGGLPEVIEHGTSGFLGEVGDVKGMAEMAVDILSEPERRREMGRVARAEARKRFCSNDIIPQYEKFYRSVLEEAS